MKLQDQINIKNKEIELLKKDIENGDLDPFKKRPLVMKVYILETEIKDLEAKLNKRKKIVNFVEKIVGC